MLLEAPLGGSMLTLGDAQKSHILQSQRVQCADACFDVQ